MSGGLGGLHQARREVDDVSHHRIFAALRVADRAAEGQAAGDADAAFVACRNQHLAHGHGRAHRALRIINMAQRRQAEYCDQRSAFVVDADLVDAALEAV